MFDLEEKNKIYLSGLLTGTIIGVVTALILAPKSGKELRGDLSVRKDKILENTNELFESVKTKSSEIVSDAKKATGQLINDGIKKVHDLTKSSEELLNQSITQLEEKAQVKVTALKDNIKSGKEGV